MYKLRILYLIPRAGRDLSPLLIEIFQSVGLTCDPQATATMEEHPQPPESNESSASRLGYASTRVRQVDCWKYLDTQAIMEWAHGKTCREVRVIHMDKPSRINQSTTFISWRAKKHLEKGNRRCLYELYIHTAQKVQFSPGGGPVIRL